MRLKSHSLVQQLLLRVTLAATAIYGTLGSFGAQTQDSHSWQAAAGGTMSFEVASVRPDETNTRGGANVDLLPGDTFVPTGGLYIARNVGLPQLISFAYKLPLDQLKTLVEQVSWLSEPRYDIEARAVGDPTKDQYRLMMQSLLAERFKVKVHYESRQLPVFELRLNKSGKLGPNLRLHSSTDAVCLNPPTVPPSGPDIDSDGFPLSCGTASRVKSSTPKGLRFGGRNVTIAQLTASPMRVMADLSRPLIDQTGIQGTVDFTIEWALAARNVANSTSFKPDESLPRFR